MGAGYWAPGLWSATYWTLGYWSGAPALPDWVNLPSQVGKTVFFKGAYGPEYYDSSRPLVSDIYSPNYDPYNRPTNRLHAIWTEGQLIVKQVPTEDYHVLRKADVALGLWSQLTLFSPDGLHNARFILSNSGVLTLTVDGTVRATWP